MNASSVAVAVDVVSGDLAHVVDAEGHSAACA